MSDFAAFHSRLTAAPTAAGSRSNAMWFGEQT
jgi:hypothetical protein